MANKSDWNQIESEAGFGGVRLSNQEQDEILIGITNYLITQNFSEFAQSTVS
jgi:hypothetical protein